MQKNMIGHLPDGILECKNLRTLELSNNNLNALPANLGDLGNLMEVALCENQITSIPSSIGKSNCFGDFNFWIFVSGQLKKLEILKLSKNSLTELTPAICSCVALTDLILCENNLSVGTLIDIWRTRFFVAGTSE